MDENGLGMAVVEEGSRSTDLGLARRLQREKKRERTLRGEVGFFSHAGARRIDWLALSLSFSLPPLSPPLLFFRDSLSLQLDSFDNESTSSARLSRPAPSPRSSLDLVSLHVPTSLTPPRFSRAPRRPSRLDEKQMLFYNLQSVNPPMSCLPSRGKDFKVVR